MSNNKSKSALIVVDMINSYDFEDADKLRASVERALPCMADLVERAREKDVRTIYVNDNHGAWHQGRAEMLDTVMEGEFAHLVEPIAPGDDVDFVVKARHSIFYETPLEYLLRSADIGRIVLVGQVTEQCILYSALDAYIRHFEVVVPPDAVAAIHPELHEAALKMMEMNMDADLTPSDKVRLS
jgi:nicotinamidase-related amidase